MPQPIEYYGVWAASRIITGIHNSRMEERIGQRDATRRAGTKDAPLWLCERVLAFAMDGRLTQPLTDQITFYTVVEGARFVGITPRTLQRILPKQAPAVLVPPRGDEPSPLYPLSWLYAVRTKIASGEIPLQSRSLTRPKMGAQICKARHRWASDQNAEEAAFKRANPYAGIRW